MRLWVICSLTILAALLLDAQNARDSRRPISLVDLVPPADPLHRHNLQFDARFAQFAADYLDSGDRRVIPVLAALPATRHLQSHAQQFDYDVPKNSGDALVDELLARSARKQQAIRETLAYFVGPLLDDPHWVNDALNYLPPDFRFSGTLFLISGYDIGVALAPDASLNAAHRHFEGHPRELLYYAIHELHHVGLMTYVPPPRISELKTCADVLRMVDYSTALEGTAVLAGLERRRRDGALKDDEDYVALADTLRMQHDDELYFQEYDALARRDTDPADQHALAVLDRMSSGERLWYRVGARMAERIEQENGRPALIALITSNPGSLVSTYRKIAGR
ncbi:MAG TPA: DUF5700 domain-containing putative Zn-dependent protease [Vicinamibacterales bacterium]|jgi:hypothetical protein